MGSITVQVRQVLFTLLQFETEQQTGLPKTVQKPCYLSGIPFQTLIMLVDPRHAMLCLVSPDPWMNENGVYRRDNESRWVVRWMDLTIEK